MSYSTFINNPFRKPLLLLFSLVVLLCFFGFPSHAVSHSSFEIGLFESKNLDPLSYNFGTRDSLASSFSSEIVRPTFSVNRSRYPNSKIAILCSAILPGGGQIYNRKYWKLPIVWGAAATCAYAILWNNDTYTDYVQAFKDYTGPDPLAHTSWQDYLPFNAKPEEYLNNPQLKDRLRRGMDTYRRQRDLSIIAALGIYLLNILDAYVDAELYRFDISPDLSMQIQPSLGSSSFEGFRCGLACRFSF
ncbi:Uncharacterised protein [Porphyromonas crevioricanis]|uniref:DUF5683 domain-containing protein n=1 Tax=Porphyromonas crevioricanis TaxID=393921 RepID=A0A2X4PZE7_9PORP|nr:hypothetical protein SAMN02745203_01223 [Porphyromonas crevioricanis]SQH73689.1 Uncharacterised protein [Porphyromonas crevioricanis]